jgi:probable F420-dependent oxidoreductase
VLATLAASTRRVLVGANVFLVPLRHPLALARIVTTLDYLSGGRFVCGVGVGGSHPAEFDALSAPFKQRGRMTDEALDLLLRVWREPSVSFAGEFFSVRDVGVAPLPVQRPHPPLWIGGTSEAALRRAARVGQGWLAFLVTPDELASGARRIAALAAANGRSDDVAIVASLYAYCGSTYEAAVAAASRALSLTFGGAKPDTHRALDEPQEAIVQRFAAVGRPEDCAQTIARFVDAGATHVILNPLAPGVEIEDQLRRLAEDVLPLLPNRQPSAAERTRSVESRRLSRSS